MTLLEREPSPQALATALRPLGPVYDLARDAGPALRESLEAGAAPAMLFPAVLAGWAAGRP